MIEVREGSARFLVPELGPARGPASSKMAVFYNPAMALARDLCVLVVSAMGPALRRPLRALDGLAGTGVRAIRLALETGIEFEALTVNDRSREARELIARNAALNGLEGRLRIERSDLNALLATEKLDYIDIDPFGSPAPFLHGAARAVRHGGLIGLTATDTGPLCGTNPWTCYRRYLAFSMRSEHMRETAARILAGYCARVAASQDVALRPALVHWGDHYIRVYARAMRSAAAATRALRELGYVTRERRLISMEEGAPARGRAAGPLWLGELFDPELVRGLAGDFRKRLGEGRPLAEPRRLSRALSEIEEEAGMPPFFFELDSVVRGAGSGPPCLSAMISSLRSAGFRASRTHFSPTGFRTDAPPEEVRRLALATARAAR
ncbi:MAG: tRNA (guanine(10)-N(2))-dimethyltransferase [Thermoplasmatota archaeon]